MFTRALASSSRLARTYSTPAFSAASEVPTGPGYFVERTASGMLPVYSDIRNGGNDVSTLVRKVRGNVQVSR
jgi:hypothetical protein